MKDQEARDRISDTDRRLHELAIRVYKLEQNSEIEDIPFQTKSITLKDAILLLARYLGVRFGYFPEAWTINVMPKQEENDVELK